MSDLLHELGLTPGMLKAIARVNGEREAQRIPPEKRVTIPFEAMAAAKREREARAARESAVSEIGSQQGEANGAAAARFLANVAGSPLPPVALSEEHWAVLIAKYRRADRLDRVADLASDACAIFGGVIGEKKMESIVTDLIEFDLLRREKRGQVGISGVGYAEAARRTCG